MTHEMEAAIGIAMKARAEAEGHSPRLPFSGAETRVVKCPVTIAGVTFESRAEAGRELGFPATTIRDALEGRSFKMLCQIELAAMAYSEGLG